MLKPVEFLDIPRPRSSRARATVILMGVTAGL